MLAAVPAGPNEAFILGVKDSFGDCLFWLPVVLLEKLLALFTMLYLPD